MASTYAHTVEEHFTAVKIADQPYLGSLKQCDDKPISLASSKTTISRISMEMMIQKLYLHLICDT